MGDSVRTTGWLLRSRARVAVMIGAMLAGFIVLPVAPASAAPSWKLDQRPAGGVLLGVSCIARGSWCQAVGHTGSAVYAQQWDGTTWKVVPSAGPKGAILSGVSCTFQTFCAAVGAGGGRPVTERWNGKSWSNIASPRPGSRGQLAGVSCLTTSWCVAVGSYYPKGSRITRTLIVKWNGKKWAVMPSPNQASEFGSALADVSCASKTACMAVGGNVAVAWNGAKWSLVPNPAAPEIEGGLRSVSCVAANACMGVGSLPNGTFTERWNGTTWSVVRSPTLDASAFNDLFDVSCAKPNVCKAVGWVWRDRASPDGIIVLSWNGKAWQRIRSFDKTHGNLVSVSCSTVNTCKAVGYKVTGSFG